MKSFDEYWSDQKKNGFVPTFSDVASNAFKAGQQSKQAEVDELIDTIKTSAESEMYLFDELQKVKGERDELQKRIDEALECVDRCTWNVALIDLKKILKGDQS